MAVINYATYVSKTTVPPAAIQTGFSFEFFRGFAAFTRPEIQVMQPAGNT
jgi:hypothetical protein